MNILLRKVMIRDPFSPHDGEVMDILIRNGTINGIESHIDAEDVHVIDIKGLRVSTGWVDIFSDFADPGFEHKESLESGAQAAIWGGYTRVFLVPNTSPALHSKSQVEYIIEKSRRLPVWIQPLGAITKNTEGRELAEMYDMSAYHAAAFSDGFHSVQSSGLMIKALQYVKALNGVIIQLPDDRSINPGGLINEGIVSTRLGLPGKPVLAEELMVARDIRLAAYANSRLHITGITAAKSIALIREAKSAGIQITCSVTPHHLYFCDEDLNGYDTNLKVNLPFRTKLDRESLLQAVLDGTVDLIASHHQPHEWDSKTCEFEYAKSGVIGLESSYSVLNTLEIPEVKLVELLSVNARKIFGLPTNSIQRGNTAELTLFIPDRSFTFGKMNIKSKSSNSPFIGHQLKGSVIGTINKESLHLNESTYRNGVI